MKLTFSKVCCNLALGTLLYTIEYWIYERTGFSNLGEDLYNNAFSRIESICNISFKFQCREQKWEGSLCEESDTRGNTVTGH